MTIHTIVKLEQLIPHVWADARAEVELFRGKTGKKPLDDLIFAPFSVDFLFSGPTLSAILTMSEPMDYTSVYDFIREQHGKPLRVHYGLYAYDEQKNEMVDQPPYMDLTFSGLVSGWGPRRFSTANRHSYFVLLNNLQDAKSPGFRSRQPKRKH